MQYPSKFDLTDSGQLPRLISYLENKVTGYEKFLEKLPYSNKNIIGITGPPGAGKSTIVDALIKEMVDSHKKVAVLCIDPSSAFNHGALLGDRIRMSQWYTHPDVFIRSLASRGSLGGLHPMILEIAELVKQFPYDHIIIETVGVGQNEIEIAGLADTTVVVMVPEAGDEIQTMKSGILEIADIFVVNKSDRPDADSFIKNLRSRVHDLPKEIPVIKTVGTTRNGIEELYRAILKEGTREDAKEIKLRILAARAFYIIQKKKMQGITSDDILHELEKDPSMNLYKLVHRWI